MKCLRKITIWVLALYFIGHIGHSNIQLVPSRIIFEKGWMRASVSAALTEAHQGADLAAFLAISLGRAIGDLGLI